jgi:hypothetical protein
MAKTRNGVSYGSGKQGSKKSKPANAGSVKPNMHKMYDGLNVATRPIPVIIDESDRRAILAAAADQRPKQDVVNMPSGPRPSGTDAVFGTAVGGAAKVRGGVYNPPGVSGNG